LRYHLTTFGWAWNHATPRNDGCCGSLLGNDVFCCNPVVGIHKETLRGKDWDSDFMKGKTYEHLATFTLMLLGLCGNALSQAAEFSSYYSGNRYDFRLTHDQLLNTPVWLENAKTNRIHLFRHALPVLLQCLTSERYSMMPTHGESTKSSWCR